MSRSPVTPETLAAALAARLVHDLSGPASGVASGLELHAAPDLPEMKADGLNLAAASSYALVDLLEFCRVAFGATGEPLAADALGKLAQTQFTGKRAALDWSPSAAELSGAQAQALLILAQIAAGGLALGGTARATTMTGGGWVALRVEGQSQRAQLQPEALEGMAGRPLSAGLAGRWAPAYYLHNLATGLGGSVHAEAREDGFVMEARLPA